MALRADYCSLEELKAFMRIPDEDTADDVELELAITTASRDVDVTANRSFGLDDPAVARIAKATYHPSMTDEFWRRWTVDLPADISSTTGLVVKVDGDDDGAFETTLTLTTDYLLYPWNAAADGMPWERIVLTGGVSAPRGIRPVEVTAKWGWAAVPDPIKLATKIQAQSIVRGGRDSPLGVAGSPEFGNEMRLSTKLHPDAALAIRDYVKLWGVA